MRLECPTVKKLEAILLILRSQLECRVAAAASEWISLPVARLGCRVSPIETYQPLARRGRVHSDCASNRLTYLGQNPLFRQKIRLKLLRICVDFDSTIRMRAETPHDGSLPQDAGSGAMRRNALRCKVPLAGRGSSHPLRSGNRDTGAARPEKKCCRQTEEWDEVPAEKGPTVRIKEALRLAASLTPDVGLWPRGRH